MKLMELMKKQFQVTKKRLEEENVQICEEKKALMTQLESEQGNLESISERQAKASALKKLTWNLQVAHAQEILSPNGKARTLKKPLLIKKKLGR